MEALHRRLAPTPDGHQGEVGAHESNQLDEDYKVVLSICGEGVETKRGSRPRWLEPHTSDAPSRTSIAARFWLAWSSGQARRVWTVRDRRV